jgi:hypothetical protein
VLSKPKRGTDYRNNCVRMMKIARGFDANFLTAA